ncbi:MAG: HD domain-containing protein [Bacteroidales bacterium]
MDQKTLISQAEDFIANHHKDDTSGHGYWHIKRVEKTAVKLAGEVNANVFLTQLAALLHDLDDYKSGGDEENLPFARKFLESFISDRSIIQKILTIIQQTSFKGANVKDKPDSLEAMCVQDADRLDAIGAIGIARTFAYGGSMQRPIYDPAIKPFCHTSYNQYKNNKSPTINHFYEKLLLLKDKMNTPKAKELAENRHTFMEKFLEQFYREWPD